ncbi:MAG: pentapeptide repeat-containing protein [Opitutaceae bacterium]
MEPTITCGKQYALNADLTGSRFEDVCLVEAEFENVNLSGATLHDINMSDITVSAAQLGGAKFKHIGPPPDEDGKQERQRPVTFEEMMLCDSIFRGVDLTNVKIVECDVAGMTIDGVLVSDLIAAYESQRKARNP